MIDLDRNSKDNNGRHSFKDDRQLELALSKTLKHMKEKLGGYPTILFTIGEYHIYQPIEIPTALEKNLKSLIDLQNNFYVLLKAIFLTKKLIQKIILPSFRSCLLRIP